MQPWKVCPSSDRTLGPTKMLLSCRNLPRHVTGACFLKHALPSLSLRSKGSPPSRDSLYAISSLLPLSLCTCHTPSDAAKADGAKSIALRRLILPALFLPPSTPRC